MQDADGAWVTVDPNPEPRPIPEREPDQPHLVSRPQSALPPPAERPRCDDPAPTRSRTMTHAATDPWLAVLLGVATSPG